MGKGRFLLFFVLIILALDIVCSEQLVVQMFRNGEPISISKQQSWDQNGGASISLGVSCFLNGELKDQCSPPGTYTLSVSGGSGGSEVNIGQCTSSSAPADGVGAIYCTWPAIEPDKYLKRCVAVVTKESTDFTKNENPQVFLNSGLENYKCCGDERVDAGILDKSHTNICYLNPNGTNAETSWNWLGSALSGIEYNILTVNNTIQNYDNTYNVISDEKNWYVCSSEKLTSPFLNVAKFALLNNGFLPKADYGDKYSRFMCSIFDSKGRILECVPNGGQPINNIYSKVRQKGSPATVIKEFGENNPECLTEKNCVQNLNLGSRNFKFDISIEPSKHVLLAADIPLHDFYRYSFIELYANFSNSFNLDLVLYSGTSEQIRYKLRDYIVNTPLLGEWTHIKIPIDSKRISDKIDSLSFESTLTDTTESLLRSMSFGDTLNVIQIDRIFLSGSDTMFCSGAEPYNNVLDYLWIRDMDNVTLDNSNRAAGSYACANTLSYGWTGTKCCGDDNSITSKETYTDTLGGCLFGEPITEPETAMMVEFNEDGATKDYVCKSRECIFALNSGTANVRFANTAVHSLKYLTNNEESLIFNDKDYPRPSQYSALKASGVPMQLLFFNNSFHGCNASSYIVSKLGADITNDDEFCNVVADYFCSPPTANLSLSEWSRESSGGKASSERNTLKNANCSVFADLDQGICIEESCCPSNYCWNGYECVAGLNVSLTRSVYNRNMKSFSADFGTDLADPNYDLMVCSEKDSVVSWKNAYYKEDPENTTQAYCLDNSQCYSGEKCVETGYYSFDSYCDNGFWSSRTKLVAMQLLNISLRFSPENYTVYCDEPDKVLNNYFTINNNDANPYLQSSNNYCVARFTFDGTERVVVGTSLNEDINVKTNTLFGLDRCLIYGENKYRQCQGNDNRLWWNNNTQTLIYSQSGIEVFGQTYSEFVFKFLMNPYKQIMYIIQNIIKPVRTSMYSEDFSYISKLGKFSKIYLSKLNSRYVYGVIENIGSETILSVSYYNFTQDICSKVSLSGVTCSPVINASGVLPSYHVISDNENSFSAWVNLSPMLRLSDIQKGNLNLKPSANIVYPIEKDTVLYSGIIRLKAEPDPSIQGYYWSYQGVNNNFAGVKQGYDLVVPAMQVFPSPGLYNLTLITIGQSGTFNLSSVLLCVTNFNPGDSTGVPTDCNPDFDSDGITNIEDNCPHLSNSGQADIDNDSSITTCNYFSGYPYNISGTTPPKSCGGDACDLDNDNDGVYDLLDPDPLDNSESLDYDFDSNDTVCDKITFKLKIDASISCGGNKRDLDDDNDGIFDELEPRSYLNPNNPDSDSDGLLDGYSKSVAIGSYLDSYYSARGIFFVLLSSSSREYVGEKTIGSNPTQIDSDLDLIRDYDEYRLGFNITNNDTDSDGLGDYFEMTFSDANTGYRPYPIGRNLNVTNNDTDSDGMIDSWEIMNDLNPIDPSDATIDSDGDLLVNLEEFKRGLNPNLADSDSDGINDDVDSHPLLPDTVSITPIKPLQDEIVTDLITEIKVATDKDSSCRYTLSSEVTYESYEGMNIFTTTGAKSHALTIKPNSENTYFIFCKDNFGLVNTVPFKLNFTVLLSAPSLIINSPKGETVTLNTMTLSVSTNVNSTCKFGFDTLKGYDELTNVFTSSDTLVHTAQISVTDLMKDRLDKCKSQYYFYTCKSVVNVKNLTECDKIFSSVNDSSCTLTTPGCFIIKEYNSTSNTTKDIFMKNTSLTERQECRDMYYVYNAVSLKQASFCDNILSADLKEECKTVAPLDDVTCNVDCDMPRFYFVKAIKKNDVSICNSIDVTEQYDKFLSELCKALLTPGSTDNSCVEKFCGSTYVDKYDLYSVCKNSNYGTVSNYFGTDFLVGTNLKLFQT